MLETKKKYKILVIDDSISNRAIMTSILEKDYFLEEACDGKQAILILEERAQEFSLVLLDIMKDSFEVLKIMKECGWLNFLPVIMVFPEYTAEDIETAYRLGVNDIIQGPYNEKIFYHRITNTIALSMKHRELSNALVNEVIQENENSSTMISILSHIVETRNGESGNHVQNIRNITNLLLKELMKVTNQYSFSKEEVFHICTASSLHDIGKMTVPEEILNKPGKLTDEEFQILKGHAMAGANMVDALRRKGNVTPLIQMTYDICRWHHERYDARHYSDVVGRLIPLDGKIAASSGVDEGETLPLPGGEMSGKDAYYLISALKFMVHNVRLVDPHNCSVIEIDSSGRLFKSDHACFHIWKQDKRCTNCISMMCMASQKKNLKLYFSTQKCSMYSPSISRWMASRWCWKC